jgi:hypothetical protein
MRLDSNEHGAWRSLVSAPVWGTGGRRFESVRPDQRKSPQSGWVSRYDCSTASLPSVAARCPNASSAVRARSIESGRRCPYVRSICSTLVPMKRASSNRPMPAAIDQAANVCRKAWAPVYRMVDTCKPALVRRLRSCCCLGANGRATRLRPSLICSAGGGWNVPARHLSRGRGRRRNPLLPNQLSAWQNGSAPPSRTV